MPSNAGIINQQPKVGLLKTQVKTQALSDLVYSRDEYYSLDEYYLDGLGQWEYPEYNVINDEMAPINQGSRTI